MPNRTYKILRSLYRTKRAALIAILCGIALILSVTALFFVLKHSLKVQLQTTTPKQEAKKIAESCPEDLPQSCLRTHIRAYAQTHPFSDAKKLIDELQQIRPDTTYCHPYAHVVSIAEVAKNPQNWQELFAKVPSLECSYGYVHGIIEGKFIAEPDFSVDQKVIDTVCLQPKINTTAAKRSCSHAMGHILLTQQQANLPEALAICSQINDHIKQSCYQGVFMEHIQKENLTYHQIETRPEWNREYLEQQINECNKYSDLQQTECWRSLSPLITDFAKSNNNQIVAYCYGAEEKSAKRACIRESFGRELVAKLSNPNQQLENPCQIFEKNNPLQKECLSDSIEFTLLTSAFFRQKLQSIFCPLQTEKELQDLCQKQLEK